MQIPFSLIAYSLIQWLEWKWSELYSFFLPHSLSPWGISISISPSLVDLQQVPHFNMTNLFAFVSGSGLVPERASQVAPHDDEAGGQELLRRWPGERKGGHVTRSGQLQWSQSIVPDEWPPQSPFNGLTAESCSGKCNFGAKAVVDGDNDNEFRWSWPGRGAAAAAAAEVRWRETMTYYSYYYWGSIDGLSKQISANCQRVMLMGSEGEEEEEGVDYYLLHRPGVT